MSLASVAGWIEVQAGMGQGWSALLQGFGVHDMGTVLPPSMRPGPMRRCYANAGQAVASHAGLLYCEGYAMSPGCIPVQHAWCMDEAGHFIDPTWIDADRTKYVGIVFEREFSSRLWGSTRRWEHWGERPSSVLLEARLSDVLAQPSVRRWSQSKQALARSFDECVESWILGLTQAATRSFAARWPQACAAGQGA